MAVWYSVDSLGGTIGTDADILVAHSIDDGASWTAPAALNTNATSDSKHDCAPQIIIDDAENWMAVWSSGELACVRLIADVDILVARSTDDGASWTDPVALNTNATSDSAVDSQPQLATDGEGNWIAVWTSTYWISGPVVYHRYSDIMLARSTDNGVSWTAPAPLFTNTTSFDSSPQVAATDDAGSWMAVWESDGSLSGTIGLDRDILVARSTDGGASWTNPVALNANATSDSGHDDSPQITTDGAGSWVAVWYSDASLGGTIGTDEDILVARSLDDGASWTAPAALNTNATSDSGDDFWPRIATDSAGGWLTVWSSWDTLGGTIGGDSDILVARSTDDGASWTAPAALNTNATSDSGNDYSPQVTTNGAGSWVAVWDSTDPLGGAIGEDLDILVARH